MEKRILAKGFANSGAWSLSDDKEGFGRTHPNTRGAKRRRKSRVPQGDARYLRDSWAISALPHVASASIQFRIRTGYRMFALARPRSRCQVHSTPVYNEQWGVSVSIAHYARSKLAGCRCRQVTGLSSLGEALKNFLLRLLFLNGFRGHRESLTWTFGKCFPDMLGACA